MEKFPSKDELKSLPLGLQAKIDDLKIKIEAEADTSDSEIDPAQRFRNILNKQKSTRSKKEV